MLVLEAMEYVFTKKIKLKNGLSEQTLNTSHPHLTRHTHLVEVIVSLYIFWLVFELNDMPINAEESNVIKSGVKCAAI